MGIFGGTSASRNGADSKTIIAAGCRITGELSAVGAVLLDGDFEGSILEASSVSVGVRGRMHGLIRAQSVIVAGQFEGVIHCASLDMLSQARVTGEVHCEQLMVEKGGVLDGRCNHAPYEATLPAQRVLTASSEPVAIED